HSVKLPLCASKNAILNALTLLNHSEHAGRKPYTKISHMTKRYNSFQYVAMGLGNLDAGEHDADKNDATKITPTNITLTKITPSKISPAENNAVNNDASKKNACQ